MKNELLGVPWASTPPRRLAEFLGDGEGAAGGVTGQLEAMSRRLGVTPLRDGTVGRIPESMVTTEVPPLEALVFSRAAFGATPEHSRISAEWNQPPQLEHGSTGSSSRRHRRWRARRRLAQSTTRPWEKPRRAVEHQLEDEDFDYGSPRLRNTISAILRAIYSRRQLAEVLADFWHNHFNVYGWHYYVAPVFVHYDRESSAPTCSATSARCSRR